jgi:hypothetical protein
MQTFLMILMLKMFFFPRISQIFYFQFSIYYEFHKRQFDAVNLKKSFGFFPIDA